MFRSHARLLLPVVALAVAAPPSGAFTQTSPASAANINIPLSDARNIGPNSVRFSAAQTSRNAPTVVLFGATTPNWHKARAGLQQAAAQGYRVSGVIMGPTNQPPSLEIYAKGQHVTKPINLNEISQAEIARLLRDVWREYYA